MIGLVLVAALVAALTASGLRLAKRRRRRRLLQALPGGSRETAIAIDDFADIEDHLSRRECLCGGLLTSLGERSERDPRLLRVIRVECRRCEDRGEIWFDATRAYH